MIPTLRERELMRGMKGRLNELAIYAGAGGGILGTHLIGTRIVGAVELDEHARRVLCERQQFLGNFPVWTDCRTFDGRSFRALVDVVSAGFPCQPFSVAGKQKGPEDERNGWPHAIRIICEVRPAVALLENVPGLLSQRHGYFGTVLGDLAESGFDAVWDVLGADDVGARHRRKRLWVLAYSVRDGAREVLAQLAGEVGPAEIGARRRMRAQSGDGGDDVSDAIGHRGHGRSGANGSGHVATQCPEVAGRGGEAENWRATQSGMGGVADGMADRVERPWATEPADVPRVALGVRDRRARLRSIGNGQVPLCAAVAWRLLARRALEVIR